MAGLLPVVAIAPALASHTAAPAERDDRRQPAERAGLPGRLAAGVRHHAPRSSTRPTTSGRARSASCWATYEYKAALNDAWTENYGANAAFNGANIALNRGGRGDATKFYYSHATHWVTSNRNATIATAAGSFQSELGCPGDWAPDCLRSWLQDPDGNGVYTFVTDDIPAGDYAFKAALDEAWTTSYPASDVPFSVTAGDTVTFTYTAATNAVTVNVEGDEPPDPEDAALARHSLRDDLTDEVFYFVLPDRFDNGDATNDQGGLTGDRLTTGLDPTDKGFYHGGDVAGLLDRLDYIESLGTTAVWMAPIFKNRPVQGSGADASAGYHGYWITDFTQIDPHFGTNAELEAFVDAAHARGIKVFFDIITNHTADVVDYAEATYAYRNKATFPYVDAEGNEFDDRDYAGTDTFPRDEPRRLPVRPGLPDGRRRDGQGPGLAERPDDVPQPRRLDVRRRELRVRRLLRPRRPVHRAPRGRRRDDRHLRDVGDRRRDRRLPDRHRQARQHRVLAAVQPGPPGTCRDGGQRRLLHVRRGVRREPRLHVAATRPRASCRPRSTSGSSRAPPNFAAFSAPTDALRDLFAKDD